MTNRSRIIGLTRQLRDQGGPDPMDVDLEPLDNRSDIVLDGVDPADELTEESFYEEYVEAAPRRLSAVLIPTLLIIALAAWSGFFGWTFSGEISRGLANDRTIALITSWSVPALLLGVIWLLMLRNSHAEAARFGETARLLRLESEALEVRMRTVNEEIALAREFLAHNARELETLGRQAARHLIDAAEQLSASLADSDAKAKTLEAVSNAATSNLEQLRKQLPVVTSAAKDVTNQIGSAGNNAQVQVKSLITSLQHVGDAGKAVREYLDGMEVRACEVGGRLDETVKNSALLMAESTTLAESRTVEMASVMAAAAQKLNANVTAASSDVDRVVNESSAELMSSLGLLRGGITDLSESALAEDRRIAEIMRRISVHIEDSAQRISEVDAAATDQTAKLAFAVSALGESTREVGVALTSNQGVTDQLLQRSDGLLANLAKVNTEIEHSLPGAMARMDERFAQSTAQLAMASGNADALDIYSDNILVKLTSLENLIGLQRDSLGHLMSDSDEQFAARHVQADALVTALNHTRDLVEELSETTSGKLVNSLLRVRETTKQAAESSRKILDEELATVAERLSDQNKTVLASAIDDQVARLNETMQASIDRNLTLSETATERMAEQLTQLNEMAGNLEKRLSDTRDAFEGADDDSFARRMVVLTESLNSTSIDVAKILSNDVADTAWAAYLKGDRGVFTRRAVRLLDVGEVREIAAHYGNDGEFREHVNRYIHDFEAMMRVLLSTRDGNAIGVTLLSSDIGKLYVALAQAIERLRN